MVVYVLSGCGREFRCSHLNVRYRASVEQGVPWHSGNCRVWIHSERRTWHDKNIQSNLYLLRLLQRQLSREQRKKRTCPVFIQFAPSSFNDEFIIRIYVAFHAILQWVLKCHFPAFWRRQFPSFPPPLTMLPLTMLISCGVSSLSNSGLEDLWT